MASTMVSYLVSFKLERQCDCKKARKLTFWKSLETGKISFWCIFLPDFFIGAHTIYIYNMYKM